MFENPRTALATERLRASLRVVPVRNSRVTVLPSDEPGELRLAVDLRYGTWGRLLRRLLKARTSRSFALEGIGREVYEDVDGRSTFEELIERFAGRHRLTFFEARALLAQYYQVLAKRGLVVATAPRPPKGGAAPAPQA